MKRFKFLIFGISLLVLCASLDAGEAIVEYRESSSVDGLEPQIVATPTQIVTTRNWTIFAVARVDEPLSIGILSSRDASVPLVQLDVDENSRLRFIARDRLGIELKATIPIALHRNFAVALVFQTDEDGASRARLTVNSETVQTEGKLTFPLWGQSIQIGALDFENAHYAWKGDISEVELYDFSASENQVASFIARAQKTYSLDFSPSKPPKDSWNVLNREPFKGEPSKELTTDVCVIGGGSAGCAAAIAAGRAGARVVLIERQKKLGGTGSNAFVSNWEGGPGDATARELFERMKALGGAGVAKEYPHDEIKAPMGLKIVAEDEPYENSLTRIDPPPGGYRSVAYLPSAFDQAAREMLAETGNVEILDETTFFQAELNKSETRVVSALCETPSGAVVRVKAKVFIDSSGDVWLCRAVGVPVMLGCDAKSEFNEESAPADTNKLQLNAIARCYLVEPRKTPKRETEEGAPFPQCAYVSGWLNGPRVVNMLTSLPGSDLIDLGYDECLRQTEKIVRSHWRWLQTQPGFENYELTEIAPMLGIREGYRARTKYVLRESDLVEGWDRQKHNDMIAIADHPCDIHGANGQLTTVKAPYGVPYRCLVPDSPIVNLLVACRGSGFSRIAASSCRLQRTMIQLGAAAGLASAWALEREGEVEKIDVDALVHQIDARSNYPRR